MNIVHLGICRKYTCEHVLKERGKNKQTDLCTKEVARESGSDGRGNSLAPSETVDRPTDRHVKRGEVPLCN